MGKQMKSSKSEGELRRSSGEETQTTVDDPQHQDWPETPLATPDQPSRI